jgi:uncharacterized protein
MAEDPVFRRAGISYIEIPASDPQRAAAFYREVFGWRVDTGRSDPSFQDGTGHVIGHFVSDVAAAAEAGIRPYIYVDNVAEALERIMSKGGTVIKDPYPEGNLTVATFTDPAGNLLGIWQRT